MPFTPLTYRPHTGPYDRIDQFNQELLTTGGFPLGPFENKEVPPLQRAGLGELGMASLRTTLFHSILKYYYRRSSGGFTTDLGYDPFLHLKDLRRQGVLDRYPWIDDAIERGWMDTPVNKDEMFFYLEEVDTYYKDLAALASRPVLGTALTIGANLVDPTTIVPVAKLAKLAKTGSTAMRVIKSASVMSLAALANEKFQNAIDPVTDTPGLTNELVVGGLGGLLGGTVGLITSPAVKGRFASYLHRAKIDRLKTGVQNMMIEPVIRHVDPAGVKTDSDLGRVSMLGELESGKAYLRRILETPLPDKEVVADWQLIGDKFPFDTVVVLRGDAETEDLLKQAVKKFADHDLELNLREHPSQSFFDDLRQGMDILNHPALGSEATPEELDLTAFDQAVSSVTRRYANLLAKPTPAGRLSQAVMGRVQEVFRTLSGSVRTTSSGSAASPFDFDVGAPAEGIKSNLNGAADGVLLDVDSIYKEISRSPEPLKYLGQVIPSKMGRKDFGRAVVDVMRRQMAVEGLGLRKAESVEIDPILRKAVDRVRDYFDSIAELARRNDLLEVDLKGRSYLPVIFDPQAVRRDPRGFVEQLVASQWNAHHRGLPLGVEEIDGTPAAKADQAQIDGFFRRVAQDVLDTIRDPRFEHGAFSAMPGPKHLKKRKLNLDYADLSSYLINDLDQILHRYSRSMNGRLAVAEAIRLNPVWIGAKLADGTPVSNGQQLLKLLDEEFNVLERLAAEVDKTSGKRSLLDPVSTMHRKTLRDLGAGLDFLEGRDFSSTAPVNSAAWRFFGRQIQRWTYSNKMGSAGLSQVPDLTPVTLHMIMHPFRTGRVLAHAALPRFMRKLIPILQEADAKDLELLGSMHEFYRRSLSIGDLDYVEYGHGFGEGAVRAVSGAVDQAGEFTARAVSRLSLLDYMTRLYKEADAVFVYDHTVLQSRKLLRAARLMADGLSQDEALKRVKLPRWQAAGINRMGFNSKTAQLFHEMVYEHGLLRDGQTPIRSVMSFDDYVNSNQRFRPNFSQWGLDSPEKKDLMSRYLAHVTEEVDRNFMVTPGAFDRPIINRTWLGRVFNTLQTFLMAFAGQRLKVMAQMPARYQFWYVATYAALGALTDAISNHLSGRRSFQETAQMWEEQPIAMMYAAVDKSGLTGYLSRPLALGTRFRLLPTSIFGDVGSSAARQLNNPLGLAFGPTANDLGNLLQVIYAGANRKLNVYDFDLMRRLTPLNNLVWFRLMYKTTGIDPFLTRPLIERQRGR